MSRFVINISESKRKKLLIWGILYIAWAFFSVVMLIYYLFNDVGTMLKIFYILSVINFGSWGYERLQKRKRKEFFLEINLQAVTWVLHETGKPTRIPWNEIRWIKKEKNETILIFRESSFSVDFSLRGFQEEDKIQILALLEEYAAQRQIRLVNFSTPALALA